MFGSLSVILFIIFFPFSATFAFTFDIESSFISLIVCFNFVIFDIFGDSLVPAILFSFILFTLSTPSVIFCFNEVIFAFVFFNFSDVFGSLSVILLIILFPFSATFAFTFDIGSSFISLIVCFNFVIFDIFGDSLVPAILFSFILFTLSTPSVIFCFNEVIFAFVFFNFSNGSGNLSVILLIIFLPFPATVAFVFEAASSLKLLNFSFIPFILSILTFDFKLSTLLDKLVFAFLILSLAFCNLSLITLFAVPVFAFVESFLKYLFRFNPSPNNENAEPVAACVRAPFQPPCCLNNLLYFSEKDAFSSNLT